MINKKEIDLQNKSYHVHVYYVSALYEVDTIAENDIEARERAIKEVKRNPIMKQSDLDCEIIATVFEKEKE